MTLSKSVVLLSFFLVFGHPVSAQDQWTVSEVDELKLLLRAFLEEDVDRAPGCLRLAFHDCVGYCDGCLNFGNPANGGLEDIYAEINDFYNNVMPLNGKTMSRADFFNLAGIVAVDTTVDYNNISCDEGGDPDCITMPKPPLRYLMGRKDCATSPDTEDNHEFPQGFHNHAEVMDTMKRIFNLNTRQTVAILGAHTLGEMTRAGSGFDGSWKAQSDHKYKFDNRYYKFLLDDNIEWTHRDANEGRSPEERWQWTGKTNGEEIANMLDADIDLVKLLDIEDEGGHSTCNFEDCPEAPTKSIVQEYADNEAVWVQDFADAFEQMTSTVPDPDVLAPPIA